MKKGKFNVSLDSLRKFIIAVLWLSLIVLFLIKRDKITFEMLLNYTPSNTYIAIIVMLFLFLFKSIVVFFYGGILYAVSGAIFPIPLAILVNTVGTVIMYSVPYFIGYKSGSKLLDKISVKHPKVKLVQEMQQKNEFLVSFFVRIVGLLPADVVSMYLGASKTGYSIYIFGGILGMLPSIISFSVMGMSVKDVTSPAFIISIIFEVCLMASSLLVLYFLKKRKNRRNL